MISKTLIFPLVLLATSPAIHLHATDLSRDIEVTISLGRDASEISADISWGEDWKPLFFAVDSDEGIHIPDFYKQRIAVFDMEGSLVDEIPVGIGISPRMNYFGLSEEGHYVTYDDSTLFCLGSDGKPEWLHLCDPT